MVALIIAAAVVALVVAVMNNIANDTRIVEQCFSNAGRYYTR